MRRLESNLKRTLQWAVCQLHGNGLPFQHLFKKLDGKTSGPNEYSEPIGRILALYQELPVFVFDSIRSANPRVVNIADLSSDQKYLLDM